LGHGWVGGLCVFPVQSARGASVAATHGRRKSRPGGR